MPLAKVEKVSLNEVVNLTEQQAKTRYNIGRDRLKKIAEEAGAVYYIGSTVRLYSRPILDEWFIKHTE